MPINSIIVESKNDRIFIQAIVNHLNIRNTIVDEPICVDESDFTCLNGLDPNPERPTHLITKLKDIKSEIPKLGITNIGIILDADNTLQEQRLAMINTAIREAFHDSVHITPLARVGENFPIILDDSISINISCYLLSVDGRGELENVLKSIASQPSEFADCLESWKECIIHKNKTVSDKEFTKFWISNYIRFDTCSILESRQANKYCSMHNFDYIMNHKNIFNLDSTQLESLRHYLSLFRGISEP